jgi:hypothetical protein
VKPTHDTRAPPEGVLLRGQGQVKTQEEVDMSYTCAASTYWHSRVMTCGSVKHDGTHFFCGSWTAMHVTYWLLEISDTGSS